MLKKEKQAIYEWVSGLNDEQLKKECWNSISKTLGSKAEEMYERGYDIEDIREQQKIEKYYSEESELLENLCKSRPTFFIFLIFVDFLCKIAYNKYKERRFAD